MSVTNICPDMQKSNPKLKQMKLKVKRVMKLDLISVMNEPIKSDNFSLGDKGPKVVQSSNHFLVYHNLHMNNIM